MIFPFTCSLCQGRSIVQRIWRNQRTRPNGQTFRTPILQETWKSCEEHPREMSERKWIHVGTAQYDFRNINMVYTCIYNV